MWIFSNRALRQPADVERCRASPDSFFLEEKGFIFKSESAKIPIYGYLLRGQSIRAHKPR